MKTLYQKILGLQNSIETELKARTHYYENKSPAWKKSELARIHDITTDGLFDIYSAVTDFIKKSIIIDKDEK